METVKEKPKSQAQINRERAARKRYREKQKRQAVKDATILSRAAATKTPAPKAPKRVAPVAPAADSQEIAGLRAEVERLTAENAKLQAEIKTFTDGILIQQERYMKVCEEKAAIEKVHQSNMDFLKANHGQWMLIQWEED